VTIAVKLQIEVAIAAGTKVVEVLVTTEALVVRMDRTAAVTVVVVIKIKAKVGVAAIVAAAAAVPDEELVAADGRGVEEKTIGKGFAGIVEVIVEVIAGIVGVPRGEGAAELKSHMATDDEDVAAVVRRKENAVAPQVHGSEGGAEKESVLDLIAAVQVVHVVVMQSVIESARTNVLATVLVVVLAMATGLAQKIRTVVNREMIKKEHQRVAEAAVRVKRNLERMKKVVSRAAVVVVMERLRGSRSAKLCRKQLLRV